MRKITISVIIVLITVVFLRSKTTTFAAASCIQPQQQCGGLNTTPCCSPDPSGNIYTCKYPPGRSNFGTCETDGNNGGSNCFHVNEGPCNSGPKGKTCCVQNPQLSCGNDAQCHLAQPGTGCAGDRQQCGGANPICCTAPNVFGQTLVCADANGNSAVTGNCKYQDIKANGPPPPPCADKGADKSIGPKGCQSVYTAFGPIYTSPSGIVTSIFRILLGISGGVAILIIIFSGYQILASSGNPDTIQAARERMTAAIVGLLFMIFSLVILQIIGVDILQIPQFIGGDGIGGASGGSTGGVR